MRLMKLPHGPSLQFRVTQFSLMKDVVNSQAIPRPVTGLEFTSPPLVCTLWLSFMFLLLLLTCSVQVVLNNFGDQANHMQLMSVTFQNLFPPINIQTVRALEQHI